jgi:AcrR family transcriptional regulator
VANAVRQCDEGAHGVSVSQRSDALRNRQRVLDAAVAAYAESGPGFGMHDVARRANVGVGTVYRHFADREELIDAIAKPFFDRSLELAEAADADAPAGTKFTTFVRAFAEALAEHGVTGHCAWESPAAQEVRTKLRGLVAGMLATDQEAGTIRADLTREDASAVLLTITMLVDATRDQGAAIWRRHVDVVLDGLRPGGAGELRVPPVAPAAWEEFVRGRSRRAATARRA